MVHATDPNYVYAGAPVAVFQGKASYPLDPPFGPDDCYPEYPFGAKTVSSAPNHAYFAVREALRLLGMDRERYGTADWNPFATIVRPGNTVVIKPNFVRECRDSLAGHGDCTMTHGAVIRAVLDYVFLALDGRGRLIIADAPQDDADFDAIRAIAGFDAIQSFYATHADLTPELYDLRQRSDRKIRGVIVGHVKLAGDPQGYATVDLGSLSAFSDIEPLCDQLYGSDYDTAEIRRHHKMGVHEYSISRSLLAADCVIEIPKLKTHKKVGITANMKLLVGICGNKNWVAHYRVGAPSTGGDQFAEDAVRSRLERAVVHTFKSVFPRLGPLRSVAARPLRWAGERVFGKTGKVIRSGNWFGNDTAWRMAHDLYRILLYADATGKLCPNPQRKVFSIVDGIVGGEGDGPLDASARPVGVVVAGADPGAVDVACARLMGFDWKKLAFLRHACCEHPLTILGPDPDDIEIESNLPAFKGKVGKLEGRLLAFEPHFGWQGHLEVNTNGVARSCAG